MTEAKPGTLFVKSSLITVKRLQVLALILQMRKQNIFSILSPASLSLEVKRPVLNLGSLLPDMFPQLFSLELNIHTYTVHLLYKTGMAWFKPLQKYNHPWNQYRTSSFVHTCCNLLPIGWGLILGMSLLSCWVSHFGWCTVIKMIKPTSQD